MPLTDGVGLGIGTWYVNPTEQSGDNDITDELDFYISLGTTIGAFDVAIGHTWYYYPESREGDIQDDTNELFVSLGTEVGGIAVGAVYAYDMDLETHYTEVSLGYGMAISDVVALEASVNVGFLDENYAHSTFSLGVPVALTGSATLTPYVAAVFPTDDRDIVTHAPEFADLYEGDDEVIGGVSLSVSF